MFVNLLLRNSTKSSGFGDMNSPCSVQNVRLFPRFIFKISYTCFVGPLVLQPTRDHRGRGV